MIDLRALPGRLLDISRTLRLAGEISRRAGQPRTNPSKGPGLRLKPVIFFNASTRLSGLSQNAAFSLLASWALRLAGVPVIHFVCQAGMSRCVLGTDQDDISHHPPCGMCIRQSRVNYAQAHVHWFSYHHDETLAAVLSGLSLDELTRYQVPLNSDQSLATRYQSQVAHPLPLGSLVLPSIRWRLRRHTLMDDEETRGFYRQFMLSAWNVACAFTALLDQTNPQAVLVFNGQFFPEATAAWLARQRGIRTITHEVGFRPLTGFFTTGEATIYPMNIPSDFVLSAEQDARLEAYLAQRFKGHFSMAGIQFWSEMKGLDAAFLQKAAGFKYIVPVFTNVIFDTSQPHSNVVFPTMFAWLDLVLEATRRHPETLFVLRAHPDEARPGKSSRENVAEWAAQNRIAELPNVILITPNETLSSYELIQRSKFVMIYNSTIGLEASILGKPVLCAGRSRFTQYSTVFFPPTQDAFWQKMEEFLAADEVKVLPEHRLQARRLLYFQLYRTSLPFEDFLETTPLYGYVRLKHFAWDSLLPPTSPAVRALLDGVLEDGDFLVG